MSKGVLEIINESAPSDYEYTVPDRAISIGIQARNASLTITNDTDPDTWTIDLGAKEAFNGDVACVLRGTIFKFNGSGDLEIRTIIDNRY